MNDFTERSFDAIFAKCTNLVSLNLDLSLVPVHNASTFLAHQPKLAELELKRAEWASFEEWLKLFGAVSRGMASVTVGLDSLLHVNFHRLSLMHVRKSRSSALTGLRRKFRPSVAVLLISSDYGCWCRRELAKLEDAWKWRGVQNVNFVTRPRANDYFGSFGGPEMPALGWR